MIFHLFDIFIHPSPLTISRHLAFDDGLHNLSGGIDRAADAAHDDEHGENLACRRKKRHRGDQSSEGMFHIKAARVQVNRSWGQSSNATIQSPFNCEFFLARVENTMHLQAKSTLLTLKRS